MPMKAFRIPIAVLLGLGFLLLLAAAVLRLLPIRQDPLFDFVREEPFPILTRLVPFIGLASLLLLFAGIFRKPDASNHRLAVSAALFFGSLLPGTGRALEFLYKWAIGRSGEPMTLSLLSSLGAMLLPPLAFALLLVGALLAFPAWTRWATGAAFTLLIAATVHVIVREWPHWRNVLREMKPWWLQQSGILSSTWFGMICIAIALLLFLIPTRDTTAAESESKPVTG